MNIIDHIGNRLVYYYYVANIKLDYTLFSFFIQ